MRFVTIPILLKGQLHYRLEAIAQDAELEEFSKSELEQLGNELLTGCQKAQSEYEEKIKEAMKKPTEDGKRKQVWFSA